MARHVTESWDDDIELEGPIVTHATSKVPSVSSRLSIRSESNAAEEDWQLPLKTDDGQSILKAINSAKLAGIPIPANVPTSALVGGSIKRLGRKRSRKNLREDWGDDLELPDITAQQELKIRPVKPEMSSTMDDLDDWTEGSLGIRFGGTRRESKNRSSSIASPLSPSIGSVRSLGSEGDGLDGLVLPQGPLNFDAILKRRRETDDGERPSKGLTPKQGTANKDDFLDDIDFGDGDVFDPKRRALNRNIKQNWKPSKDVSSSPKTQTTLTFTEKPGLTKIPRPVSTRVQQRLEPVFESGTPNFHRTRRPEPTTTSAQLLRSKRSMPVLRHPSASSASASENQAQSIHTGAKHYSPYRGLENQRPQSPPPRAHSRLSIGGIPDTPTRSRQNVAPAHLSREATTRKTVTRPARARNFGDGSELDTFDDLPYSTAKESRYVRQPISRPSSKALRNQSSQSKLTSREKMVTPQPPRSPTKLDSLPRFARDTAASRIAREQTLSHTRPRGEQGPLVNRINWTAQVAARSPHSSPNAHRTPKKGPQLVKPMGKENARHFQDDAAKKGMQWNPTLLRWEGNESALLPFGLDKPPPSPPRPALITNFSNTQGVQVVGGMVFDPQRMCWLKLGAGASDPRSPSVEDEDDPFGGIEDLQETRPSLDAGVTMAAAGSRGVAISGDWLVGEEFDLGPEFIRRQRDEEHVWRQRVAAWTLPAGGQQAGESEKYKWAIQEIAATIM